ncbi:putative cyclase [Aspergillus parasiticus SU-1]|uniref:Putative cyclase n=1 Tax=Aspergillus parasiticus (strain ATCC 56775 / NRRL 5862 / SRRC 143 / SU-1) TaxID=1403190 RepID=A0A0F0IEJ9_ASPPU|nr:putative cyclase [Aspergillus parasiticus SU-1]
MPQGCAWGVVDREGQKDYLGCLNLLTPSVVQAALKEGRDGESVSLNWPINAIHTPGFLRKGLERKVISFQDSPYKLHGFDDEISFNTQSSSQWDSLGHFAHQPSGLNYNGTRPTADALSQLNTPFHKNCDLPTLDHWHACGALVSRGVLVDYCTYADAHGIKYNPFDAHQITVEYLEAIIEWEQLDLRQGDILILRSGFTRGIEKASMPDKQKELLDSHRTIGVEGTKKIAKWIWDPHFAAVAGDAITFEQTAAYSRR